MADASRAEHLREMIAGAEKRMSSDGCSDQNYAVLGRMRAEFLAQIDEIEGAPKVARPQSVTDEFTARRKKRGA